MSTTVGSKESGSAILREFQQAMAWRRAGGHALATPYRAAERSFESGQVGDAFTAGWHSANASINALLTNARPLLVMRSRHWGRNTGTGRRFLNMVRDQGVGPTGFRLQMRCGDWRQEKGKWIWKEDPLANDAIERAWTQWCQRGNCDATGRLSFADVCKTQLERTAVDGEYLARHLRGAGNKWRYQVQLLATERLDHDHNLTPFSGHSADTEVRMGVHRDSAARPVAYTLLRWMPNDTHSSREQVVVPAREVLHDFITLEPEQARGVPWAHAVLLDSNMLKQFESFAVFAAQVGASQQGFIEQSVDAALPGIATAADVGAKADTLTADNIKTLAPGAVDWLPKGATFKAFTSQFPSETFDPFVNSRRRVVSAGLNVAYHNLTGDMTKVNYSSARIAELAERDGWRGVAHWFIGSFVQPVFAAWLEMALLAGEIRLPGGQTLSIAKLDKYLAGASISGRGWDWVDPLKEVAASKMAREEGLTTRTQTTAAKGGDFEDNVREIARENALLAEQGVTLGAPAPAAPKADKPASDDDETDDDETNPADD